MKRNEIIFLFGGLSTLIALLWYLGLFFSLYWIFWWYDLIMHFLGGFWIGLIVYILFLFAEEENFSSRINLLLSVIMSIFVVGVMWEWFELERGLTSFSSKDYAIDTIMDLVIDLLGAITSYYLILNWRNLVK